MKKLFPAWLLRLRNQASIFEGILVLCYEESRRIDKFIRRKEKVRMLLSYSHIFWFRKPVVYMPLALIR